MTEKYALYENAIAERINGILKQEFGMAKKINDFKIKKKLIKNAINIYNTKRPHLSNHMSIQMHQQNKLKRIQNKKAEQ